ncbi:MAG: type II secretion system F family protein [Candidatus Micrarchaeota archaeon]|nr:type II secretion system F family protein [Candidatus Micrarchaeota archaeon]
MTKYTIEKKFSTFVKPRSKDKVAALLAYAGIESNSSIWLGSRLLIVLLFGVVGMLIPMSLFQLFDLSSFGIPHGLSLTATFALSLVIGLAFALLVSLLIYMHLYYLINERTARVDAVLPDFLLMVAANLRSGMTPFAAFQASARPEFGPLQSEILYVSSSSLGTESFSDALRRLTENIDSAILRRIIAFFENGLRSGGKLAYLLEVSAEEIRETQEIRQQMIINTKSYEIFIVFILLLGLPLLLAISTQFLTVFTKIQTGVGVTDISSTGITGISSPKITISVVFIEQLAYFIILGSTILSSILVGVIAEGKVLYGLKYAPPLGLGALFFFTIFKIVISGFLAGLV